MAKPKQIDKAPAETVAPLGLTSAPEPTLGKIDADELAEIVALIDEAREPEVAPEVAPVDPETAVEPEPEVAIAPATGRRIVKTNRTYKDRTNTGAAGAAVEYDIEITTLPSGRLLKSYGQPKAAA